MWSRARDCGGLTGSVRKRLRSFTPTGEALARRLAMDLGG
jgi:hypothetical protein